MSVRGAIARRLSGLRSRGAATPILNEVALPAEVLFEQDFAMPSLSIPSIPSLSAFLKSIPGFAHGKASGSVAGQWYRVTYPTAIKNATPVAIGLGRIGQIVDRTIPISSIAKRSIVKKFILKRSIVHLAVPLASPIPRVSRDDFNDAYYCDIVAAGARDRARQLAPPWPLDTLWGWFCDTFVYGAFYSGWYFSGWILNVLWDSFIQPQIDKVQDKIMEVVQNIANVTWAQIDKVQDALQGQVDEVQSSLQGQVDEVQSSLQGQVDEVQSSLQRQIGAVQDAVNLRLDDLYNMWGIPSGMIATPLHIRNPTNTGFEFQSFGSTTCTWIAIGERTV